MQESESKLSVNEKRRCGIGRLEDRASIAAATEVICSSRGARDPRRPLTQSRSHVRPLVNGQACKRITDISQAVSMRLLRVGLFAPRALLLGFSSVATVHSVVVSIARLLPPKSRRPPQGVSQAYDSYTPLAIRPYLLEGAALSRARLQALVSKS